jgi:hypothetical protein
LQRRFASTLVVADHDNATVSAGTLSAITAAQKLGGATVLIAGSGCGKAAEHAGMWQRAGVFFFFSHGQLRMPSHLRRSCA